MRATLPLVLLAALLAPAAAADVVPHPDFVLEIAADGTATVVAGQSRVEPVAAQPGARYEWNVRPGGEYVVGEIRVRGGFDVASLRQILPLWQNRTGIRDDHFFGEAHHLEFGRVPLVNFSGTKADGKIRVGFPGPEERTILLVRDTEAPRFQIGNVRDLASERGSTKFLLTTGTNEFAFADLQIRKAGTSEWVQNPTTIPALEQTFPIQGLKDNSTYEYRFRFWDWPGNEVWSDLRYVDTPPSPIPPKPIVRITFPEANAVLDTSSPSIRATFETPGSPLAPGGLRVFLDKRETSEGLHVDGPNLTFRPSTPLASGPHSVSIELLNEAGGKALATVLFRVGSAIPLPETLAVAALALAAVGLARRRAE